MRLGQAHVDQRQQQYIVLLGPPGVGKGTLVSSLNGRGVSAISTGEVFRSLAKLPTPQGQQIRDLLATGRLFPDDLTCEVIQNWLGQTVLASDRDALNSGALFDGFPRTLVQAKFLDNLLASYGRRITCVLVLVAPTATIRARLIARRICPQCRATYNLQSHPPQKLDTCDRCQARLSQRSDDTEDAVLVRLEAYERQTSPLISYYEDAGVVRTIDADRSIESVRAAVEHAIEAQQRTTA